MNLILIAAPAAGKGTIASILHEKYNLVCISAGELLRGVDPDTELGKEIREIQSRRELVDDRITNALMKERLMKDDINNGFILDGYPRRMAQVEAVNEMCEELNLHIDKAIVLNVSYDCALKRTLGREICPECKKTYNSLTGVNAPKVPGMCDDCNVALTKRNDDNEETFKAGYKTFNENCPAVIEYYRNKGILLEVDAEGTPEETLAQIENAIGSNK